MNNAQALDETRSMTSYLPGASSYAICHIRAYPNRALITPGNERKLSNLGKLEPGNSKVDVK